MFENNRFQGTMPDPVCDLFADASEQEKELSADCSPEAMAEGSPPYVDCDCCTKCP
jgi:hypothetical protein